MSLNLSASEWHERYLQQARWTKSIRDYLIRDSGLGANHQVLEVGCGTGAVLKDVSLQFPEATFGLDINIEYLKLAQTRAAGNSFIHGDAINLPFRADSFDLVFCHFFMMWVENPIQAVSEMIRTTRNGGSVITMAEPDYGGRIDYPEVFEKLGLLQTTALKDQGADPQIGRKLGEIYHAAGLEDVQTGVIGAEWRDASSDGDRALEWAVLQDDLGNILSYHELNALIIAEREALNAGSRILFVPTFFAKGIVSK